MLTPTIVVNALEMMSMTQRSWFIECPTPPDEWTRADLDRFATALCLCAVGGVAERANGTWLVERNEATNMNLAVSFGNDGPVAHTAYPLQLPEDVARNADVYQLEVNATRIKECRQAITIALAPLVG